MTPIKIYFAAPFFSAAEQQFNTEVVRGLEFVPGAKVFLPQRDGASLVELCSRGDRGFPVPVKEAVKTIRYLDCEQIVESRLVVAVLDGVQVDDGTAYEVGFASGRGIPWVGLRTDKRSPYLCGLNPMLQGSALAILSTPGDLAEWVRMRFVGAA